MFDVKSQCSILKSHHQNPSITVYSWINPLNHITLKKKNMDRWLWVKIPDLGKLRFKVNHPALGIPHDDMETWAEIKQYNNDHRNS